MMKCYINMESNNNATTREVWMARKTGGGKRIYMK